VLPGGILGGSVGALNFGASGGAAASFFGSCARLLMTWLRSAVDQPTIAGRSRLAQDSIQATISL
jgi:hypothetical protein